MSIRKNKRASRKLSIAASQENRFDENKYLDELSVSDKDNKIEKKDKSKARALLKYKKNGEAKEYIERMYYQGSQISTISNTCFWIDSI